jgi:hypothetical protein
MSGVRSESLDALMSAWRDERFQYSFVTKRGNYDIYMR